jgi:tRNA threonylcarbamoyladenosine biosynthesis protein TsaE
MEVVTKSVEETQNFAKELAKDFKGNIIALSGDLGAGKTAFAQGFAEGLGIKDKIISPTFVLIRQHKIPNSKKVLYHVDLYRLEHENSIRELGLEELFVDSDAITLIEWAERAGNLIPSSATKIDIEVTDETSRKIKID